MIDNPIESLNSVWRGVLDSETTRLNGFLNKGLTIIFS